MKRLVVLSLILVACGDNHPGAGVDAHVDSMPADTGMIDGPDIDAMPDAPPTPAERIAIARALPDGVVSFGIIDATITYIKPVVTGATVGNDPGGFTIQIDPTGPALMIEADVTMLTPTPAVGDVVSFTIGEMKTAGMLRRGATITSYTRTTAATDITALVQNVTAATDLVSMVGNYESEVIDATATIADAFANSGSAFQRAHVTTTGIATLDTNLQLRLPTTFKDTLVTDKELVIGCVVAIHRTPVNRFNGQFQISAFNATDLTVTSCPAPTVASAIATDSTHVTVTFSRNIDMATVMANGSQFTISDGTNPLAVSAAAVTGKTVTLTTATQTPSTSYTVTVANTVEDTVGDAVGTPNTATFTGFIVPIPTVMMAVATNATTVEVTFTRPIAPASVMADGTQFTIVDNATPTPNALAVSAASVSGMVVTLTTAAQTTGTIYTVTVANTVTDTNGTAVGAPSTAMFTGFTVVIPSVMMASATAATTVAVTFTRNIDMTSVMANGSQFTIVDDATPTPNALAVSAASVSGMVVTLTTAAQTPGTNYTVTVATTVTDTIGTAVGAPLSATFAGFTPAVGVNHLVINEVDYNQIGSPDASSFIEIYNPTAAPIALADFAVVYGNGAGGAIYPTTASRVMLSTAATELPAGGYLVIANTSVTVAGGALKIDVGTGDFLQNGPDGVGLINTNTNTLVDSLFYGALSGTATSIMTIMGFGATVDFIEAPAFTTDDTTGGSLGRFPNGADTNHAMADWALRTTPTPGATN